MTAPYRKVNYGKIIQKYALTVSLALLAPIVLILIGVITISIGDRRSTAINIYNSRVLEWKSFEDTFRNTTFYLDNKRMHLKEMPQEYYFPVADSCNKSGDPSGGCLYSESIYHSFNYTVSSEVFNFTISDKNHKTILSDLVPLEDITRHSQRNLGCWDLSSCTKACDALSGVWNAYKNECIITRYLNKICYRVTYQDGKFVLDTSSLIDPEVGCYYSNLWSPYLYADSDHKHVIINLRYYLDPVISASEETRGCSDDKLYWKEDGNCFGATVKDQLRLGKQVLLIGLVLLLIEVILIVGLLVYYVYHNRRVNPKIQMSASMEMMFTPYSVDELTIMHSPHVEEIQEWTASQKSLLSS